MALCGTSNGFTVVRWEHKEILKKIVRLDILSTVTNLFVSVKNLNYVLSCKTNEDFLCNPTNKKKDKYVLSLLF